MRMGAGPERLARELGIAAEEIKPRRTFLAEIGAAFDLYGVLSERIQAGSGVPVVLSGNCGASVGTAAGIGMDDLAVVWFDAHGDFMTPETTSSGFLDGMALSIVTGRCFRKLSKTIPGFTPLPHDRALHVGGRDWSEGELADCHRERVNVARDADAVAPALDVLKARTNRVLIHIDLDVIDSKYGKANQFAVPDGLSPDDVVRVINICGERFEIAAIALASYDPSGDPAGAIAKAGALFVRTALTFC